MNILDIKAQAELEIAEENRREAVDAYKRKLREKKWWHKLFPFKIVIIRRD